MIGTRISIECPKDRLAVQEGAVVFLTLELWYATILCSDVIFLVLFVTRRVVVELGIVSELGLRSNAPTATRPCNDIVGSRIEHSVAVVIGIVWP